MQIAREELASLLHADSIRNYFTSGATESVNLALKGVYELLVGQGKAYHYCFNGTPCRAGYLPASGETGCEISYLPVEPDGLIDPGYLGISYPARYRY